MATNIWPDFKTNYRDIKVLYVEDEVFSREKILRILSRRFSNVYVAIDGLEGLQLYQKYHPDLIIADIKMNQMSGLEMIAKIRERNEKVQIIVTTAHDESDYLIQSIENSVNHFILKPINLDHFLLAIQKSVYQIQLVKELDKQKRMTRRILDFQDNLIFVVENEEIVEFNHAFSTFTGIDRNNLPAKSKVLANFFVEDPTYYYPKENKNWVKELLETKSNEIKVKWKGTSDHTAILFLKATQILEANQVLFVCTDITNFVSECKKNELLTMMDPLTKSFNHLKFDGLMELEISRAERYSRTFSIILMDIDYFKNVNDYFGHQKGDEVLVTLSTIVQQRIRESDIFARWGGEEFIILTPETNREQAKSLAESIRLLIEDFPFQNIGPLTCSFGIAEFSSGKTKRELFLEADQALHQSKKRGRNCVTISTVE